MNANVYEGMFLLDPNQAGNAWESCKRDLENMLTERQAEILFSEKWDERRLAYEIKGQRKGVYALTYFRAPAESLVEIERDCHLSPMVLRSMILRVEPKHVDAMLAKARGEELPETEAPKPAAEAPKPAPETAQATEQPAEPAPETPAEVPEPSPAEETAEAPAETPAEATEPSPAEEPTKPDEG